jgi:hypothetical protein
MSEQADPYEGATIDLPRNLSLYRAADSVERRPIARECADTGKTGVYFSAAHPYLAETMPIERKKDLQITEYRLTRPISILHGKYAFRQGREYNDPSINPVQAHDNISHIDLNATDVQPDGFFKRPPKLTYAELFLAEPDLDAVEYVRDYPFSRRHAMHRWYNRNWRSKRSDHLY